MCYFWKNEKVELRMAEEEDADFFYEVMQSTALRMQAEHGVALPACQENALDMASYAEECNRDESELWFVITNMDRYPVGYAVVDWLNERTGNVQCHIHILEAYRRQGYATAAAVILLKYLFEERRLEKVCCCILENQVCYREFARRLGFRTDGLRREMFYIHGRYVGEYYLSLLHDEYLLWKKKELSLETEEMSFLQGTVEQRASDKKEKLPVYDGRRDFWSFDGITLRGMTEDDYLKNHERYSDTQSLLLYDSEVKLPFSYEEILEEEKQHLALQSEDNRIEFAVDNEMGEYVGNINLCGIDKKNGKFSFSIYTLPEHREKGYGKKALRLLMTYCFEELRMHKMISCVNDKNEASAALMRSVGCKMEGVLRHDAYYQGEFVDVFLFGVTKEEFYDYFK